MSHMMGKVTSKPLKELGTQVATPVAIYDLPFAPLWQPQSAMHITATCSYPFICPHYNYTYQLFNYPKILSFVNGKQKNQGVGQVQASQTGTQVATPVAIYDLPFTSVAPLRQPQSAVISATCSYHYFCPRSYSYLSIRNSFICKWKMDKIRVGQAINQFGMALLCNYKLPPHTKQKKIVQKAANSQQLAQLAFQCIPLPSCEYMSCKHGHSVATSIVEATQSNAMQFPQCNFVQIW